MDAFRQVLLGDILVCREVAVKGGHIIRFGAGESGHAEEAVDMIRQLRKGCVDLILF